MKEYIITYVVENNKTGFSKHYLELSEALKEYNALSDKKIVCGWYAKKTTVDDSEPDEKRMNNEKFSFYKYFFKDLERKNDEIITNIEKYSDEKTNRKPRKKNTRTRKNRKKSTTYKKISKNA